jgi:acyl-CoA synthetase (AMP-forming)/AMP-acid ligase II
MTADAPALPRRIHELVERWAAARPDALAVIDHDGRRFTWREAQHAALCAQAHLEKAGVRGGDRVMIVLENSLAAAAAIMACSRLDAWAVALNARLAGPEIDRIRDHCEPRAILCTDAASADAARHADRLGAEPVDDPAFGSWRCSAGSPRSPNRWRTRTPTRSRP